MDRATSMNLDWTGCHSYCTKAKENKINRQHMYQVMPRNGQPSEKLCPFYRRYIKLCSWEAHQMAVALYEQLFRDETKFSRTKSVADDY